MDYYKKALQVDPANGVAANNLAYLMVENGQNVDVALSLAQTARSKMPDTPQTGGTLGWIYYHKGNYSGARDLLEEAVKTQKSFVSGSERQGRQGRGSGT
jgi:Flp pilus assembly protein TadD